ncbi:MAG: hypothetical protein SGI92_19945 [Bryobacteraceae bacterium]|nr:hypothetical protein [Bryobacteraceae bacterium]
MDIVLGNRLIELRARIVDKFNAGNWEEIGLLTGGTDIINGHDRLLRSLSSGDEDYAGNVLTVLRGLIERDPRRLTIIQDYLDQHFPGASTYISAKPAERRITFAPYVFQVPETQVELDLIGVMMPFAMEFAGVYDAIKKAAVATQLRCLRADDIWEDSTIIQGIFTLIFQAQVVVVYFSGRNSNVMYETGIAHTLGKHGIPIAQSVDDVPFDMRHHRVLKYLPNAEGLSKLANDLAAKLRQASGGLVNAAPVVPADPDDVPF